MIEETLKSLEKIYGAKVCLAKNLPPQTRLTSGSLALDVGISGGFPRGKITTINGRHSVAKTATAFHVCVQAQKENKTVGWVSMEPFDEGWALANGVNLEKLILAQPETGEEAVNIAEALIHSRELGVVVLDSLGALAPTYELENEAENGMQGTRAKLIKKLLLKTNARLQPTKEGKYNNTVVIYLNHIYDSMDKYVPYTVAGGKAVWMFSSLLITFQKKDYIWEGKEKESEMIGLEVGVKIEKDKLRGIGRPFNFRFFNQEGWGGSVSQGTFDNVDAVSTLGQMVPSADNPLIKRGGAWFSLGEERIQGKENLWNYINDNEEVRKDLEQQIRSCYNI